MAKGRGTGPAVNLDSSIDGEGQEGVGCVEDVDQCQGHKGLLSIQHVCVVHQGVDSKHDKCDLKGSKGQEKHLLQNGSRVTGPSRLWDPSG